MLPRAQQVKWPPGSMILRVEHGRTFLSKHFYSMRENEDKSRKLSSSWRSLMAGDHVRRPCKTARQLVVDIEVETDYSQMLVTRGSDVPEGLL